MAFGNGGGFKKNYVDVRLEEGMTLYGKIEQYNIAKSGDGLIKGEFSQEPDWQMYACKFYVPSDAMAAVFAAGGIVQNGTWDDGNPKFSVRGSPLVVVTKHGRAKDSTTVEHKGFAGAAPAPTASALPFGQPAAPAPFAKSAPPTQAAAPTKPNQFAGQTPSSQPGARIHPTFANLSFTQKQCQKVGIKLLYDLAAVGLVAVTLDKDNKPNGIDWEKSKLSPAEAADIIARNATTLFIATTGNNGPGPLSLPSDKPAEAMPAAAEPHPAVPIITADQIRDYTTLIGQAQLSTPEVLMATSQIPNFPRDPEPLKWTQPQAAGVIRWLESRIKATQEAALAAEKAASEDIPF